VFLLLLAGLVALPGAPAAESVRVEASDDRLHVDGLDTEFPGHVTVAVDGDGTRLTLLGAGQRRQLMFKVYELALYVPADAPLDEPFWDLVHGSFPRHLYAVFARDTEGSKVRQAYQAGFRKSDGRPDRTLVAAQEEFLGLFPDVLPAGSTVEVTWIPRTGVALTFDGGEPQVVANDELGRSIMRIYFGDLPVNEDLRSDLVRFHAR
jgi:hypothetical protein